MKKQIDLLNDDTKSLYMKYLTTSVGASLVTSIYILADTIMVGQGCGGDALAALNIVLPVFATLFAFGMLFGVGGGVLYSVAQGNKDKDRAKSIWSTALFIAFLTSLFIILLGKLFFKEFCYFLGADDTTIEMVMDYAKFVVFGAPAFLFSSFLQAFIRNDKNPKLAMIAIIAGAITNIFLDYIFIFKMNMGLTGGAAATLIGNTFSISILLSHFFTKQNELFFSIKSINFRNAVSIIISGAPSFFIEAATGLITLTFNKQMLKYLGNLGVTAYSVVANYNLVLQSLFNGVGQAALPIMATNFGAGFNHRVAHIRKFGFITVFIISSIAILCAYIIPTQMTQLFVPVNDSLLSLSIPALKIYFLSFWFLGSNLFTTICLQSIVKSTPALFIMVMRGILLPILFAFLLPLITKNGLSVFAAVPCSEVIVFFISIIFFKRLLKTNYKQN